MDERKADRYGGGVELKIMKILVAVASLVLLALPLSFIGSVAATADDLNPHSPIHGNHNFLSSGRVASVLVVGRDYYNAGPGVPTPNYEVVARVNVVLDGDTIDMRIEDIVGELDPEGEVYEGVIEAVRFGGGIDAPEVTPPPEEGGHEATEFVENLIPSGTMVYLDLNSLSRGGQTGRPYRDTYERLVAVIYSVIDGRWVNINAELLRWGMKEYPDHDWLEYRYYPSEWNPDEWLEENYPYVQDFVERRNVMVLISPDKNTDAPGGSVAFTVFVKNIGNVWDTYSLIASDNAGWNLVLTDDLIENIVPNHVQATTLTVTIPENAENGARNHITVIATSLEEENVNNSASCTVTAAVAERRYNLIANVSPPGSGTITLDPAGGIYKEGTDVTATAKPTSGYEFDYWSGDASGTSTSVTVTMNSEKSIIAYFRSTGEGEARGELPWTWIGVGIIIVVIIIVAVVATTRGQ